MDNLFAAGVALLGFSVLFVVARWIKRRNLATLKCLAERHNLLQMDGELFDFPEELLGEFDAVRKVTNAYGGHTNEGFLMVFDLVQGWGKRTYSRTIVARRYEPPLPPTPRVPNGMQLLDGGKWRAITLTRNSLLSRVLMSAQEIEAAWKILA